MNKATISTLVALLTMGGTILQAIAELTSSKR